MRKRELSFVISPWHFPAQTASVIRVALPTRKKDVSKTSWLLGLQCSRSIASEREAVLTSQKRRLQLKCGDLETLLHCLQVTPTEGQQHEGCSLEEW